MLQDGAPRHRSLVGIGRTDDVEARDGTVGSQVLDRLMGGAVLANADGVVGPHEDRRDLHEGRETGRGTHVVGEDEEGSAVATGQTRQGDAVEDATHGVLAHTEVDGATVGATWILLGAAVLGQEGVGPLHGGVVGAGEVCRSAPQLGKLRTESAQDGSGGLAGAHLAGLEGRDLEIVGQLVGKHPLEEVGAVRVGVVPSGELLVPGLAQTLAALGEGGTHLLDHLDVNGEGGVLETELLLEGADALGADLRTMHLGQAGEHRDRPADDGGQTDEGRLVGDGLRVVDGLHEGLDVLLVGGAPVGEVDVLDVPAVSLVTSLDVLGEGDGGVALDGDPVVVVEQDEVAQFLGPSQGRRLGSDALLHAAITGNGVDVVVEGAGSGSGVRVEEATLTASCHRHADGVGNASTERAGGGLDEFRQAVLRVARGQGPPGAQGFQIGQLEAQTGQVELGVLGQRGVSCGHDEAVTAEPVRVGRVDGHNLVVEQVAQRGQGDGGAGVPVTGLLDGVGRQHSCGVDSELVGVGPRQFGCHDVPLVLACWPDLCDVLSLVMAMGGGSGPHWESYSQPHRHALVEVLMSQMCKDAVLRHPLLTSRARKRAWRRISLSRCMTWFPPRPK